MYWLNPVDPAVRSAVTSGAWGRAPHSEHGHPVPTEPTIDTIATSLDAASEILTRLTGFTIHPALVVEEDFVAAPMATKLYPSFSPVRSILSVTRLDMTSPTMVPLATPLVVDPSTWVSFGGAVYFSPDGSLTYNDWFRGWCGHRPVREMLRVSYQAGSTITASARQAVIALAHDFWLDGLDCEECGLPQRTITVNREGISYNMGDPLEPTSNAMTGVPSVDVWIKAVNPRRALRSAGVWTPDSPPPVVRSVQTARPEWGSTVHLFGSVAVDVHAGQQ